MRVILLAEHFSPRLGGAARACHELARRLVRHGLELVVVTDRDAGLREYERIDGFELYRLDLTAALEQRSPEAVLAQQQKLLDLMALKRPELGHLSGGALSFYYANRLMARQQEPWVITLHLPQPAAALEPEATQGRALRRAEAVVFVSQAVADHTLEFVPELGHRSRVIPNGYPELTGGEAAPADRVGFLGRMCHQKGVDLLLDAWPAVVVARPEACLILWGDGPDLAALQSRGRLPSVSFAGPLLPEQVPRALASCSFVVMPSRQEGHPLVALEAAAAGRAVVATRVGGLGEIVQTGQTGLLVEPFDTSALAQAMIELLENPERARRMGLAAAAGARVGAGWEQHGARYLELYGELTQ
ncbi:MAG: glycosyltransferase family 4 protein [Vulcanimicrobiota bacterium]